MYGDISAIIRHSFYEVDDNEATEKYLKATIERIKRCWSEVADLDISYSIDYEFEITIFIPELKYEFSLHNGFWVLETYFHYAQLFLDIDGDFWLRQRICQVVKVLGQDEVWYATDSYTWNSFLADKIECTFEEWLSFAKEKYGREIPEFEEQAFLRQKDKTNLEYESIYHDSF